MRSIIRNMPLPKPWAEFEKGRTGRQQLKIDKQKHSAMAQTKYINKQKSEENH